jgi:hypothetical protein
MFSRFQSIYAGSRRVRTVVSALAVVGAVCIAGASYSMRFDKGRHHNSFEDVLDMPYSKDKPSEVAKAVGDKRNPMR